VKNFFVDAWKYRELLYSLTKREITVRYKQTVIGITWAIIQPIMLMLVFTLVFSNFAKISTGDTPYPIFSYCALVPWTFFSNSIGFASLSVVANQGLVKKIYFPREIFPISAVATAFVSFAISFVILIGMMLAYRVTFTIYFPLFLVILLIQIIFTIGVSFFLSALNVYYRDIGHAVPLGVQLWMFISPVAYPITVVPENYRTLFMLNPMAGLINSYRNVLIEGVPPNFFYLGIAALLSVILFFLCRLYFKRIEMTFADVI